jgi:hypothetical protein
MAERKRDAKKLEPDPIVEALVPDPAQGPPDATVLFGYLGKSTTDGIWRLYLDRALTRWVEIPDAEILHSEQDERGTRVWVPKTLDLRYVRVESSEMQAGFLTGSIVERRLAAAAAAFPSVAGLTPSPLCLPSPYCPSQIDRCPTPQCTLRCPTPRCPSQTGPCLSYDVCLSDVRCPSESSGHCPTIAFCPTDDPSGICPSVYVCYTDVRGHCNETVFFC